MAVQSPPSTDEVGELTYDDARLRHIERAGTVRIVGIPLEQRSRAAANMRWLQSCFCVHDAPEDPCPCMGPIIGIPTDLLRAERPSRRRDEDGRELVEFVIDRDARLIIEKPRTLKAGTYAALANGRSNGRRPISGLQRQSAGGPGPANAWIAWTTFWYAVGTWLDNLSDGAISDAGAGLIEDAVDAVADVIETITQPPR
jgi:hypothetical protein